MQVHEKVYAYIKSHGIDQTGVAKKCNVSVSEFYNMMSGSRKMYAEDLKAICYALKVSPEEFIDCINRNGE